MATGDQTSDSPRARTPNSPTSDRMPLGLHLAGGLLLLVATAASVLLALEHLTGLALPGCGPGSPCAEAARSVWGSIPGLGWPVSYLGLAYFLGLLVTWLTRRRLAPALRWLIRFGALVSVFFIIVMVVEGHLCQYCLAAHLANLGFWFLSECTRAAAVSARPAFGTVAAVFVLATGVLAGVEWRARAEAERKGEEQLADSLAKILAATDQASQPAGETVTRLPDTEQPASEAPHAKASEETTPAAVASAEPAGRVPTAPATKPTRAAEPPAPPVSRVEPSEPKAPPEPQPQITIGSEEDNPFKNGFCGRYLKGPREAAVRIVMFTDYQCHDCRRIEGQIRNILEKYDNVSFSVKNFPFDKRCNDTVKRTLHPNACWAARAAEAAGILWGNEGFWKMHEWLFDRQGSFSTTEELYEGIRSLGYDPEGFLEVMTGPETLARVQADIAEARLVGLYQTPMIFINGVELRGWNARNAVERAVLAVLRSNPKPQTHAHDHPPLAVEKCLEDWRRMPQRTLTKTDYDHPLGPPAAPARIVVFGDYEEKITREVDPLFRRWVAQRDDVNYVFRNFPFNQECNPYVKSTKFERACWAARAAEAAGRLAGDEGFWRLHAWLIEHPEVRDDEALRAVAPELGFDPDKLLETMASPEVAEAVKADVDAGDYVDLKSIPMILINGKHVNRWRWLGAEKGREILERIVNEAAGAK